jgi:hypothetical protein
MIFSEELNIYKDEDVGMQLDSPSRGMLTLKDHLRQDGFTFGEERIVIEGTDQISDLVEVDIIGTDFKGARDSIEKFLRHGKIKYNEEKFNGNGVLHSRFNLEDIGVFDKAS